MTREFSCCLETEPARRGRDAPCFPELPPPAASRPLGRRRLTGHRTDRSAASAEQGPAQSPGAQQALGLALPEPSLPTGFVCWFQSVVRCVGGLSRLSARGRLAVCDPVPPCSTCCPGAPDCSPEGDR